MPNSKNASFSVNTPADIASDCLIWRDYHVKEALTQALQDRGYRYSHAAPDVTVWIWGWMVKPILPGSKHILWIIGHPTLLQKHLEELRAISWAAIYCSSKSFCDKLAKQDIHAEWMVCPGADRPAFQHKPEFDLSFVGNADPAKQRDLLIPVFSRYKSNVVGPFPNASLPHISWEGMQEVYNSGKLLPYSHHKDMSEEGFVADAVLDVMKNSGALVISDVNSGFADLGIPVPQWSTSPELYNLIDRYLKDEKERLRLQTLCRVAASKFNMKDCALRMEKFF